MNYSKEMYKQKLNEFFNRHDQSKLHLVDKIADQFPDQQEEVFKHLTAIYAKKEGTDDVIISEDSIFSVPTGANSGIA
tara:strand:- start:122260 stop:122493 length:234 start_codon:yes stop_codon:yes gene_type:complete